MLPPNRRVRVTVKCTSSEFRVTVRPWAAHVGPQQRVEWIAGGKVTHLRIRKHSAASLWPVPGTMKLSYENPRSVKKTLTKAVSGKRRAYPETADGKRVRYVIDLRFTDDRGNSRTASIDPDMVIDS